MSIFDNAIKKEINKETYEKLISYNKYVIEKNQHINLTGIKSEEESLIKNVYDSLTVYEEKYFPENGKILDLGTGGGFPGVILAILRPDMQVVLMDAVRKKLDAIKEILEKLEIKNAKTLHARAEDAARDEKYRDVFDIVTARAVKRMNTVSEWALPFVKKEGIFAAMKGAIAKEELSECGNVLKAFDAKVFEIKNLELSNGDKRSIIYIQKNSKCPKRFPRKTGAAEKNPL